MVKTLTISPLLQLFFIYLHKHFLRLNIKIPINLLNLITKDLYLDRYYLYLIYTFIKIN